jgi:hypothetical protein
MIIGLFKDLGGWFVSLGEVGVAIAAVLLIGLVVGMAAFRILSRIMSMLGGGAPAVLDPYDEDEAEGMIISVNPDEDSGDSKPRDGAVRQ